MRVPVVMPQLGLTMTEGSVSSWLKQPGEPVARGEMLFVVSTDKADMEVESMVGGELAQIVVEPGKEVPVGTVIAYIERPSGEAETVQAAAPALQSAPVEQPVPEAPRADQSSTASARTAEHGEGPSASPRAKRLAKELGVDLTRVMPGGPSGRIVEEDVRRFAEAFGLGSGPNNMSQLNIVITDTGFPDIELESRVLSPLDAAVTVGRCRTEDEVLSLARDADALMVQWAPITRQVIEQLKRCRIISRYGVGVDMIDLDAAREHGITVENVPDFCIEEVAAHTLSFLLALGRKIPAQDRMMHAGSWKAVDAIRPVRRLKGQTLGLVGVGRIGGRVAELAAPLGMRILGYDVAPPKNADPISFVDFETVVRESDFLSLHCPLTGETRHLINVAVLAKMKPSAYLLNVSRGGVVDTQALVEALSRGQIAGAAIDVFEEEPLPADHALRKLENVILTPHTAAYSEESAAQLRRDTARNIVKYFQSRAKEKQL